MNALIDLLDELDGDPDFEPEQDTGADDRGEPAGLTFQRGDPAWPVDSVHERWLKSDTNPPCPGPIA
ncbi:hypothetical protein [Sphingomonas hylomeconis]|uniref:Uncharacterized protein n=1 Tax=Sphingomonas hylomeconis TaxID=1395958 RepID=A0ABV7SSC7_9SPHN|nr:hypothetical protein [Sphingomonas hylomeconis]